MAWVYLALAITAEVTATMSLKVVAEGQRSWAAGVVLGYVAAFAMLSLGLREGLALGVAYGIWAAAGVAATAILSRLIFREPLTRLMGAGIALIIGGVLLIELGASH
ncbi:DMT family transporter [Aeromicrobium sp. Sec7.5]|uniref:DMT family transporter n=1 Tax=Aeromicrobium sp. Sec7.5 TaxID=3121276 RepID=UPI002FE49BCA